MTLKVTWLADSGGSGNCGSDGGAGASAGHNLADDDSCSAFFVQPGDLNNTPAALIPRDCKTMAAPTKTFALVSSSPLWSAIPLSDCTDVNSIAVTTDQRGASRPQGAACDMGSFEASPNAPPNAAASPDQGALTRSVAVLNGSQSNDPILTPLLPGP